MVTRLQRFLVTKILRQCSVRSSHATIMPTRSFQNPPKKKLKPNQASFNAINHSDLSTNLEADSMVVNTKNTKSQDCKCKVDQDCSERSGIVYLDTPVKPETDKKDYRVIQLENGLTALLISDQSNLVNQEDLLSGKDDGISSESESDGEGSDKSGEEVSGESSDESGSEDDQDSTREKSTKREEKMAACALSVGVGTFSDPPEIPGLAHLLEHMVFMGSEKYTGENDFDAFIKKKGGVDNASTECELTTFYFEIPEKYLLAALHRFAQFFIKPLMKKDAITREREAVESEFQMALPSDSCRKDQLFSSFARDNHPATKFSWGNLITLRDNVVDDKLYEELHKFRERHYSAHRMKLAIQARLPLEVLENYVRKCFSEVPNNNLPPDDFSQFKGADSFDTPNFHKMYRIKPVKDVCQVDLTWSMPSVHHLYKSKPRDYIAWVLEYQGKGSLISYLKKKMWCLELTCEHEESGFEHSSLYALLTMSLTLTEQGHENLPDVLKAVFSFINLVRREGPQKRIFDEIQKIKEMNFRFAEEITPVEYVEDLCENMHYFPPIDYISGTELYFEYNPEAIEDCMSYLTPDRVNIIVSNKNYHEEELDKLEPWFKTKYAVTEISPESVENWKNVEPYEEFNLPLPNPFLTNDFSLITMPADVPKYPTKVFSDDVMEIWYRPDPKFCLPDCYMLFSLITPLVSSLKSAVMMDLFVVVLKYLLEETLYPAVIAELHHDIYTTDRGITINVNGYNQKLPLVLFNIAKCLKQIPELITQELFDVLRHTQIKRYYNEFVEPKKLIRHVRLSILLLTHWTSVDKHLAIQSVNFHEFVNFAEHLSDHIYVKALIQGNMTEEDAIKNAREFIGMLDCGPLLPNSMPEIRVTQIPIGQHYCKVRNFNSTDVNSVVTNYYQTGISSIKLLVIIELLMLIMEEPLFNQLRTQEQLGYDIFCTQRYTLGILGFTITVYTQADKFTTEHVDDRIETFLKKFNKTLKKTSGKELDDIKDSLIRMKLCADVDLKEEVDRNWEEITSGDYMFDRIENELAVIDTIKIDELREWMKAHMVSGDSFRKLSVHVVGTGKSGEKGDDGGVKEITECLPSCCPKKEDSGSAQYSLMYVTKSEDSDEAVTNITDIQEYKNRLYCYPVVHTTL